jgi:DNA-directed RNA polymerase subunit H (RpoH/RPB5)
MNPLRPDTADSDMDDDALAPPDTAIERGMLHYPLEWILASIKYNQIEMMRDRGYILPDSDTVWLQSSKGEMVQRLYDTKTLTDLSNLLDGMYTPLYGSTNDRPVWVHYFPTLKPLVHDDVKNMKTVDTDRGAHIIIITHNAIRSKDAKSLLYTMDPDVEMWVFHQLIVNVKTHFLSQQYTPLTRTEKRDFLTSTRLDPAKLPYIYQGDPVVRWHHWPIGTLLQITRTNVLSLGSGMSVLYRLVVPNPITERVSLPSNVLRL